MNSKRFFNTIFFALAVYAFYLKAPVILSHFKFQDKKAPQFTIQTLNGKEFNLNEKTSNTVLVFWATWCGPCEVELKRINKMIIDRKIQPTDVLAISSGEDIRIIRETARIQNYLFNIGVDSNNTVSKLFSISATPTIVFIDKKQIINWMTSGISPSLEFRISSFIE